MATLQKDTPAALHHLCVDSTNASRLAGFYAEVLGCTHRVLDGTHLVSGPGRGLIIRAAQQCTQNYAGYAVRNESHLQQLRGRLIARGVTCTSLEDPFFLPGAFLVADPQKRCIAFGVSARDEPVSGPPARLQHTVFQTTELESVVRFYVEEIGFAISDEVVDEEGVATVVFMRSDDEHHSLAFFRGSRNEWDHHCYETTAWNDIRDWADRFAEAQIPIFFGPGRHGPGNNLFFMVTDPDGNRLEMSAELQTVAVEDSPGVWPHGERTLNSWGRAWLRS